LAAWVALLLAEADPDAVDLPGPQRERERVGPDRAARADRPRLSRLPRRPARGRDRDEQIGIGGPAGGKLPPLAIGNRRATSARYGDSQAAASSRLTAVAELATIGAGYLGCALVRLAIHVAAGENSWAGVKAHLDIVT
jgi:hypothetical protein